MLITASTTTSYVVSDSKPLTVTVAPTSARTKVVTGSPPCCGVKITAYAVILRSRSPVSSGGGISKLNVMERSAMRKDGNGSAGRKRKYLFTGATTNKIYCFYHMHLKKMCVGESSQIVGRNLLGRKKNIRYMYVTNVLQVIPYLCRMFLHFPSRASKRADQHTIDFKSL